ncbi:MAG: substrate-binding domain-containing protein [Clostridiales bacterium]|nr:substrate-binding domain-containing protein [Clostridiales bacterium]
MFDGIVVIVNNDNPIDNLTVSQIKSIFTGEIMDWDDVAQ